MRPLFIAIISALLIIAGSTSYLLLKEKNLKYAVDLFHDGDYIESIETLNKLSPLADYEKGEKIYYYRARALNKLADLLEDEFHDELENISIEKKNTSLFDSSKKEIDEELKEINNKIQSDLTLLSTHKRGRIISGGKFYDEFMSRYRGSPYIEELDFEELSKITKTPDVKHLKHILSFYGKYPDTDYIAHIVRMVFDIFKSGEKIGNTDKDLLLDIFSVYGTRYPTGPELSRIFVSTGDNVNLRNSPGLNGKTVGKTIKDELLLQLEKSMDTTQIGDSRDYWYRIITMSGNRGWIFGKFLKPFDITSWKKKDRKILWAFEENFSKWLDSNTPVNWHHIPGGEKQAISFFKNGDTNIARCSCDKKTAGLYSRCNTSSSFIVSCRARFISGDIISIFAYTAKDGVHYLDLSKESIDISGRKIPLNTTDWHDYTLKSDNGRFASLYIDGELVSGRIPFSKSDNFPLRGLYTLFSAEGKTSKAEMEYIKVR